MRYPPHFFIHQNYATLPVFLLHILSVKNIKSTRPKPTLHIISQQLKVYHVDSN